MNLQNLITNFSSQKQLAAAAYGKLPAGYAEGIYISSLNFFTFCADNFRRGSYEAGKREYERFKQSILF
jgi:hypothetical protein